MNAEPGQRDLLLYFQNGSAANARRRDWRQGHACPSLSPQRLARASASAARLAADHALDASAATTAPASGRSPSLGVAVVGSDRGGRGLRRARQDKGATGARSRRVGLPRHRRRRRKPDCDPNDWGRSRIPRHKNKPAVFVSVDAAYIRRLDSIAARDRRGRGAREGSDVRQLAVLGAAHMLNRRLMPGSRKLGEPDRRDSSGGEQPGG